MTVDKKRYGAEKTESWMTDVPKDVLWVHDGYSVTNVTDDKRTWLGRWLQNLPEADSCHV